MKIKNKVAVISLLAYLILMISLLLQTDLFISNLSGLTADPSFYLVILSANTAAAAVIFLAFKPLVFDKSVYLTALAFIVSALVPYNSDPLIMNLHIVLEYGSFIVLNVGHYRLLLQLSLYDQKRSSKLIRFYYAVMAMLAVLFMTFMAVNGLMEMIYLSTLIIQLSMVLIGIEKANNKC